MKFKRICMIALYFAGKLQVRPLQHLNVKKSCVFRSIARYRDSGRVASRTKCGLNITVKTPEMIQKVKARFDRNLRHSGRKTAPELNISRE